jgi:protein kinase
MEKYKIIETIGDGTYGIVYKGINTKTNEYVAIKKMKKKYTDWDECLSLKEVQTLLTLKHSNIVTLNELILQKNELNMIFEFIGQNLFEYAKNMNEIPEYKIRNISFQILQGLAYMHKNNFFHRDMKPENILISGDQVKLADFGLARDINSEPPFTDYVATRWYRSPEVILNSKIYSSPIDIFALGAIIAELYTGVPLFPGKEASDQMNKICEVLGTPSQSDWNEGYDLANQIHFKFPQYRGKKLKNVIHRASDLAINLLEMMLCFNPSKRPSAVKCLQHPFFQCNEILRYFGFNVKKEENEEKKNNNNNFAMSMNSRSNNFLNLIEEGNNNNYSGNKQKKQNEFNYEEDVFFSQNNSNSKLQKSNNNLKRFEDFLGN